MAVKFYDRYGKLIVERKVQVLYVPIIHAIVPQYLIIDEKQTFSLTV
jgi:hypothetical protein